MKYHLSFSVSWNHIRFLWTTAVFVLSLLILLALALPVSAESAPAKPSLNSENSIYVSIDLNTFQKEGWPQIADFPDVPVRQIYIVEYAQSETNPLLSLLLELKEDSKLSVETCRERLDANPIVQFTRRNTDVPYFETYAFFVNPKLQLHAGDSITINATGDSYQPYYDFQNMVIMISEETYNQRGPLTLDDFPELNLKSVEMRHSYLPIPEIYLEKGRAFHLTLAESDYDTMLDALQVLSRDPEILVFAPHTKGHIIDALRPGDASRFSIQDPAIVDFIYIDKEEGLVKSDENGFYIQAKKAGTTTITYHFRGITAVCEVTVLPAKQQENNPETKDLLLYYPAVWILAAAAGLAFFLKHKLVNPQSSCR